MGVDVERRLADRYELLRPVGRGAVGRVWLARDHETGSTVAIKRDDPTVPASARSIRGEYRARYDITHPALVGVRALCEDLGRPFLVLEWVDGQPLDRWVADHPDQNRALYRVLRTVTEGLAALHRHGRVHGDLKPGHVLVRPDGHAVLIDFDLSGRADDVGSEDSTTGLTGGTAGYMAPELLRGEPATEASDRYALGAVIWQVLAGRRPPVALDDRRIPSPPCDQDTALLALLSVQLMAHDPARRPRLDHVLRSLGPDDGSLVDVGACVGRSAELATLDAWDVRPAGRPLLLSAPSGLGKSTLLREHLRRVQRSRPGRTYITRCHPDAATPLTVIDGWIDALVHGAEVDPIDADDADDGARLRTARDHQDVQGLIDILDAMLSRRTARFPVRLWIDDVQWLEDAAQTVVQGLVDRPRPGLRLMLSARHAQVPIPLPDDTLHLALSGLDAHDVRAWAADKGIDLTGFDTDQWIARTSGHPGLLAILLENISLALNEPFDRRWEAMGDAARLGLSLIAVAAEPLPTRILATELGPEADGAIQILRNQRFVVWERVDGASALRPIIPRSAENALRLMSPSLRDQAIRTLLRHGLALRDGLAPPR